MAYGDNIYKQQGIAREPVVAQRILKLLIERAPDAKMQKSSILEDMRKKYDYSYTCPETQSFGKTGKIHEIKVDIKTGKTFTLFDDLGRNTLENSESDYVVYEFSKGDNLIWIKTQKLKDRLNINKCYLSDSKFDKSKYFFIKDYLNAHQDYFGFPYLN